jgi:hypothetical protein
MMTLLIAAGAVIWAGVATIGTGAALSLHRRCHANHTAYKAAASRQLSALHRQDVMREDRIRTLENALRFVLETIDDPRNGDQPLHAFRTGTAASIGRTAIGMAPPADIEWMPRTENDNGTA